MTATTPPLEDRKLILLVDDEPQIHRFLRPTLEAAGYAVARADTAADALRQAAFKPPSLVLLDLGLPRAFSSAPVIILSARDRPAEKIASLDAGANDYVEKPFDIGELLARVRVALRQHVGEPLKETLFVNPPLEMDLDRRLVRVQGSPVNLTPREYDVLALLVRNVDRVIWGPAHGADIQYLRVYIGHLRQKLGPDAGAHLTTEAGVGYRLLGAAT
jgi:two-component system KDP operon response regulator KdpE